MRILINFPFDLHWRIKQSFMNKWGMSYSKAKGGNVCKSSAVIDIVDIKTLADLTVDVKESLGLFIEWYLVKAEQEYDFYTINKIDYVFVYEHIAEYHRGW